MLPSFCREAITVSRAPLALSRGASERDWGSADKRYVTGCSVQFSGTSANRGEARSGATSSDAVLFAPPGADIRAGDRIECTAGEFAVEGEPMPRTSPTGAVSHVECPLSRWRG